MIQQYKKGKENPEFSQTFVGLLLLLFFLEHKAFRVTVVTKLLLQCSVIRQHSCTAALQAIINMLQVLSVGGNFCCN